MTMKEGGPPGFSVTTRLQDGVVVLVIRGHLDAETAPAVAVDFESAVNADGPVVVDLCGASFMDSAGLYALMVLRRRLVERERRLAVACWPSGAVDLTFRVSGTHELFDLHATRTDAIGEITRNR
jgi:anti-sigma B factor antagonist